MTSYAVDMLATTISPQAIKTAGYTAVCRYLRNLTVSEARGYLQAGLGLATIFETSATEALGGAAAGLADGRTAAGQCVALGQPSGTLLWVNLSDFAPPPSDIPAITAYWQAFRTVTAGLQVGGYATGYVIDQLVKGGATGPWWQNAMDDNGWPGTQLHPQTSLYQDTTVTLPAIVGTSPGDYDQNVIIGSSLNWWTARQPDPPPKQEVDMVIVRDPNGACSLTDGAHKTAVVSPADLVAFQNAGIPVVQVTDAQYNSIPTAVT